MTKDEALKIEEDGIEVFGEIKDLMIVIYPVDICSAKENDEVNLDKACSFIGRMSSEEIDYGYTLRDVNIPLS